MLISFLLILLLIQKIGEVDNNIPDVSGLVTTSVRNNKAEEVEEKILLMINILLLLGSIFKKKQIYELKNK